MRVLILGARAPACLEWARAFDASGWSVIVADSLSVPLSRGSKAAHQFVRLPRPRVEPEVWASSIERLITNQKIDLIVPTCEEVFYLAAIRDRLPCRVVTSDLALLDQIHHKHRFALLTAEWSTHTPESHLVESREELCSFDQEPTRWVFKPAYSRFANHTLIKPEAHHLRSLRPSRDQPWVAQRFVDGVEHCSFSLLVAGKVTAHSCYRPRYRVGQGSAIWFEPCDPPAVLELVERFGAETDFTGQVGFDFIESPDGSWWVLECNPRATSGVHLFRDAPDALVAALIESPSDQPLLPRPESRMVALAVLMFAAPRHLFDRSFWRDFRSATDVIWHPEDRRPCVTQLGGLGEIAWRALRERSDLLTASTADIEWHGQWFGSGR